MIKPTIVVPAYNRPKLLQRLLRSLAASDYPDGVNLIIHRAFSSRRHLFIGRFSIRRLPGWRAR